MHNSQQAVLEQILQEIKINNNLIQTLIAKITINEIKTEQITQDKYTEKGVSQKTENLRTIIKPLDAYDLLNLQELSGAKKKVIRMLVSQFSGRATANDLADVLKKDRSTISLYLNEFVEKQYLGKEYGNKELGETPKAIYFYLAGQSAEERIQKRRMMDIVDNYNCEI